MERIKRIFFEITGTLLLSFSAAMFIIPNNVLTGGVSGISIILSPFLTFVSTDIIASAVTVILFVVGALFLGRQFTIGTALSTAVYSISMPFFTRIIPSIEVDPLMASIYGGLLGGIGVGIVMRQGASTGGMDVPPLIMNKYFHLELSKGILIVDALTVFIGLLEFNLNSVLMGLISVYFTSLGAEKALTFGGRKAKEVKIISEHYKEINKEILDAVDRGTTIMDASGGYTGVERKVLMCVVSENQYQTIIDIVNRYDKYAFVIATDVNEVHGEGFTVAVRI